MGGRACSAGFGAPPRCAVATAVLTDMWGAERTVVIVSEPALSVYNLAFSSAEEMWRRFASI